MTGVELDAHYTDPRLVALYDLLNTDDADIRFYAGTAGEGPLRVLDIGCGTGQLATEFARRGHEVTGMDPSIQMLEVARARPDGGSVTWVHGTTNGFPASGLFDFVVMTGHVFQVFLGDADVDGLLADAWRLLKPGGRLAFETRNPADRGWERWTETRTRTRVFLGDEAVDVHWQWTSAEGEFAEFDEVHDFPSSGQRLVSHSRLRFMPQERLAEHLARAGFESLHWFGGFDGRPFDSTSREIIVVAQRPLETVVNRR